MNLPPVFHSVGCNRNGKEDKVPVHSHFLIYVETLISKLISVTHFLLVINEIILQIRCRITYCLFDMICHVNQIHSKSIMSHSQPIVPFIM